MAKAKDSSLERMRAAGLFVERAFPAEHVFPDGIFISKPTAAELLEAEEVKAQSGISVLPGNIFLRLYFVEQWHAWVVDGLFCAGGRSPACFETRWEYEDDAVDDVLKFFAGDERWQLRVQFNRIEQ